MYYMQLIKDYIYFRKCGPMTYIPNHANGKENSALLTKIQKSLQDLQTKADRLVSNRAGQLTNIGQDLGQLRTSVKNFRAEINSVLDDLESQTLTEIDNLEQTLTDRYRSEQQIGQTIQKDIKDFQHKLAKHNDESLKFVYLKQCNSWLVENSQLISDVNLTQNLVKNQFHKYQEIENCLNQLHGLGKIVSPEISLPRRKSQQVGTVSKQFKSPSPSYAGSNKPYKVKRKEKFNVKTKKDEKTCSIHGICQLPDGCFLLSDLGNQCLKKLDSTYTVTSRYTLPGHPWDVCHTEGSEVAVVINCNKIQFVSVGDIITPTRSFSTSHTCNYIAYHNKRLYVTHFRGTSVYVYDMSGSPLHTISTDQQGRQLFSYTRGVQLSPDGQTMYIADRDKGLVTLDTKGNLLATCQPAGLRFAQPVCVDGAGNVFVGGRVSDNVLQVTQEGDSVVTEIVSESDGINYPEALCFDSTNCSLLVGCDDSDTMHVISLEV